MEYYMGRLVDLFYSEQFCFYRNIAAVVGSLYMVRLVWSLLWQLLGGFCAFFLAPWGISRINLKKYGPWAVVTGASEGIGRGYALELARQGLNVVIMSRSQDKLQKVADEISELIGSVFSPPLHNVGYAQEYPEFFAQVPEERHYKVVQINCHPVVQMTHMLLPKMVYKGRGIIVNISAGAADHPMYMVTVYSATKRFMSHFSDALRKEYGSKGIIVQDVKPHGVATAMVGTPSTSTFIASPITYARAAVATIGIQHTTHGYFYHALQAFVIRQLPNWLIDRMMAFILADIADAMRKKVKKS